MELLLYSLGMKDPGRLLRPYTFASLFVLVALILTHVFDPWFEGAKFVLPWVAIVIVSWYAGTGPGLAATALATLGVLYFTLPSLQSFAVEHPHDAVRLLAFSSVSLMLVWFTSQTHTLFDRLRKANEQLRREIAEHHQTREALRESEEMLATVSTLSGIAIIAADSEQRLMYANARWAELAGTTVTEATGTRWTDSVHPDDREQVTRAWEVAVDRRTSFHIQCRLRGARPERIVWVAAAGAMLGAKHGEGPCVVAAMTDITTLKDGEESLHRLVAEAHEREEQLRLKQDQLIQAGKLATIGEMATCITHDLNNPLNNISLFVGNLEDTIKRGAYEPQQALEALRFVQQQVRRAAEIVSHLRIFARRSDPRRDLCSLHDVIETALSFVREPLTQATIDVALDLAAAEPVVTGNATQLEQVFVNLLLNARDAMIHTDHRAIRIRTTLIGADVEVVVDDTGPGVPADLVERIFEPFFTTKQAGTGTGLGLSISSTIIAAHHGTISVSRAPGGGARFILRLPLAVE